MDKTDYINNNQAFVFELDDVLYPVKDYWLQVYYLFAQFIEYGEQIPGDGIIRFMHETYLKEGMDGIFEKTAAQFNLPEKYKINFDLLQQNARLPLKLLLFAPVLDFMQQVKLAGKPIFLVAEGNPAEDLNKIRQIEWNGLEQYLKVYFVAEMEEGYAGTLAKIVMENGLDSGEILVVGKNRELNNLAFFNTYPYLSIDKLSLT